MFKRQINYEKLKFKLQICVQRLDVVLKRKKVRSLKKRKEIIHLVQIQKKKKARTGVEQIIPIDCMIDAGIVLRQLCTFLEENISELDGSLHTNLIEAIYCIIWAAPYLKHEVIELEHVAHLLSTKFGKLCKTFKNKNIAYDNLKKKLILARSGQWLSPKVIEDYFKLLIKYYEDNGMINVISDCNLKLTTNEDRYRIRHQTIAHPRQVSVDAKIGYGRPSVGNFVNERPWTTLRKAKTISTPHTTTTASARKYVSFKEGFKDHHKDISTENITQTQQRSSKIPMPTSFIKNKTISRSNSLSEPRRSRSKLLSLSSLKSLSGSLTSLKSSDSISSSVFAEEYVSILDSLFNFDKNVAHQENVITEESCHSLHDINFTEIPYKDSNNWGIKLSIKS